MDKKEDFEICDQDNQSGNVVKIDWDTLTSETTFAGMIEIEGYFNYLFENVSLRGIGTRKYLWLEFSKNIARDEKILKEMSGRRVTVSGMINWEEKGHLNMYLGTLESIYCIRTQ